MNACHDFGVVLGTANRGVCAGHPRGQALFDLSDLGDPVLVASVDLACGSHTVTGVPDLVNRRLLIYTSSASALCPWIDIVQIPLDAPEEAAFIRQVSTGRPCHDNGVILGDAMLAACAGGDGFTVLTLDPDNLDDPQVLLSKDVNEDIDDGGVVSIGHSAAFSWDGEVLIFGHEPGGGVAPFCQEDTPDSFKSAFFYESRTGDLLGMWTLPRPQTAQENCTIHNYNVVPSDKRRVLVHGSYQSGIGVVDFTNPGNAREIAFADPAPLSETSLILGGDWSSYWYDGFIYESDIRRGLLIWRLSDRAVAGAKKLGHLNPQTQETSFPLRG